MSCAELIAELLMDIEIIRSDLIELVAVGAGRAKVLEVSQELDKLIVEYYKTAM